MAHRKTSKRSKAKAMLRLADLEQSKNAVLHSLGAASSQESYGHAIDEFIGWYCSEPRLAFNRTVDSRHTPCTKDDQDRTGEAYCVAHHLTVDGGKRRLMIAALRYYDTFAKMHGEYSDPSKC